ncbi:MAG: preprotein translocase subunit SecE [Chloroflexi bacterium]|nr:preprotein translocase subunit SecE [Chloroflexota bacterium]
MKLPRKLDKLFQFFGDIISELKKVVWPTRKELTNLTLMVIVVCVVIGAFLGALDFGFFELFNKVLLNR